MIVLDRDYGRQAYQNDAIGDAAEIDATAATWALSMSDYPIVVKGGRRAVWTGGAVIGDLAPKESWGRLYALGNSAAMFIGPSWKESSAGPLNTDEFTVRGLRLHNVWDGVRVGNGCKDWLIDGCWLSHIRDDAVENDHRTSGTISDCLFDGVFSFLSSRNKGGGDGSKELMTIRESLIRLQPFPGPQKTWFADPSHGPFLKGDSFSPGVEIYDSLLVAEQFAHDGVAEWGMNIRGGKGNVLLWLGAGPCPVKLPSGFQFSADRSLWKREREAWLLAHPEVRRLPEDDLPGEPTEPDPLVEIRKEVAELRSVMERLEVLTK